MRFLFISIFVIVGFNACSATHNPNGSYERANDANEKALESLERE